MPSIAELRARLGELSSLDRGRFDRRVGGAGKIKDAKRRAKTLNRLDKEIGDAASRYQLRSAAAPKKIDYPDLPIAERRDELLDAIRDHQVVIVAGETGSGKSTQLPKMCLELGRGVEGLVAHTQPRRLAARTIAGRVAEELNTAIGGTVGFAVRFSDQVGDSTMIKLMTDGLLLAEIQRDRLLSRYDTVIVDEAHERSLNVDFLIGYLRQLLPKRPDLKVIITSATIDTERFSQHFASADGQGAPVIEVSGRTYPVEVRYRPLVDPDGAEPIDQPQGIADAVQELFAETTGDVLVFCAGEREIRDATDTLQALHLRHTKILPLYARLPASEQHKVFANAKGRRVVIATNVAETSLTVPGVRSVVDAGTARISRYSRRTKVQRLPIEPISQASANQRAGRCGRLGPGIAIRLYARDDFDSRSEFTEPEILRTSLASVILQMAAIGLGDIASFPFIDPPDTRSIKDGVNLLAELGAVDPAHEGTREWLTPLGRKLSRFPLDPRFARMILEANETFCLEEILIIAAALSVQDPRERPVGKEQHADTLHARFNVDGSDFLGTIALWRYLRKEQKARSGNQFRRMCRDEFLNYLRIREWQGVHSQLRQTADELGLRRNSKPADPEAIHKTILSGLLSHIGQKDPNSFEYRGARSARFAIQPGSVLFKQSPEWVVAAELVETTRLWARQLTAIDPDWVEQVGAHLINRSYSDPWWDTEKGSAVADETVTLFGLTLVSGRPVQFGRVNPGEARQLFIRHALLDGEWDSHHAFVTHNRQQFADVREREARGRLGDIMVNDEVLAGLFAGRIPDDVVSVRHFDAWWKHQRATTPDLLNLTIDDLVDPAVADVDDDAYPESWVVGDLALTLTYEFDPASSTDGMTVHLPVGVLDRVNPAMFEWQVPGFRAELVTALIRSLPKDVRKPFVPVPDTVARIVGDLDPSRGGLIDVLRRALSTLSGEPMLPDVFQLDTIPRHLQPHFSVVAPDDSVLATGKDLETLRAQLRDQTRDTVEAEPHPLERTGITSWDFGQLPHVVEITGSGVPLAAYPAIVDDGASVSIRLLATPDEQAQAMWAGNRRLLMLSVKAPKRTAVLTTQAKLALTVSPYDGRDDWESDCRSSAVDQVIGAHGGPATDAVTFDRLLDRARGILPGAFATISAVSLEILGTHQRVILALEQLVSSAFDDTVGDVVDQLGRLVYPGFVAGLGPDRLADTGRYLHAIEYRVSKVRDQLERDARRQEEINALEEEHDRMVDVWGWTPRLVDIAWTLQEFRVSLFAQPVGVDGPVSAKRIRAALREAAG
jgi:ATP-dependent helicase HrpA